MSNGGSIMDSIQGLFSSGGGGRERRRRSAGSAGSADQRLERVEQIATGVQMAAAALEDDMADLRSDAREAAAAVLDGVRGRAESAPGRGEAGGGGAEAEASAGGGTADEALSSAVDALEELHYRLVRIEAHPDGDSDEERERFAESARESVERVRQVAGSLEPTAAS